MSRKLPRGQRVPGESALGLTLFDGCLGAPGWHKASSPSLHHPEKCRGKGPDEWNHSNFMELLKDKCKALCLGWTPWNAKAGVSSTDGKHREPGGQQVPWHLQQHSKSVVTNPPREATPPLHSAHTCNPAPLGHLVKEKLEKLWIQEKVNKMVIELQHTTYTRGK